MAGQEVEPGQEEWPESGDAVHQRAVAATVCVCVSRLQKEG